MSMSIVARGRILDPPVEITSKEGPLVCFRLGDAQFGLHRYREYEIEDLPVVDVNCRGAWFAAQALERLVVDQYVVVVGSAHISQPFDQYDGRGLVLLSIDADTVGADLARSALAGPSTQSE